MRALRHPLAAVAALLAATSLAGAQTSPTASRARSRAGGGGSLVVAQPLGAFHDNVRVGVGGEAYFLYRVDEAGVLALRVDGGFIVYGSERRRLPLSPTLGDLLRVDVETTNSIAVLGVGPQLMAPRGSVRPYVNGTVGLAYFSTRSSVEGSNNEFPFAETTNLSDGVFAYTGGGGVLVPVRVGRTPILIDLGARYHQNGTARYLTEKSIDFDAASGPTFTPIESEANMVTYRLGVTVGF